MKKAVVVIGAMSLMVAAGNLCSAAEMETANSATAENETAGNEEKLAELTVAGEGDAIELGLSEQQLSEAYAYAAYNISENYLKPNELSGESLVFSDMDWGWAYQYYGQLRAHGMLNEIGYHKKNETSEQVITDEMALLKELADVSGDEVWCIFDESIFTYCYYIEGYDFSTGNVEGSNELRDMAAANINFSDEQLSLGESVAEEMNQCIAEHNEE